MHTLEKYHIMKIARYEPGVDLAMAVFIGTCHFENKSQWTLNMG